jgi:high-affinity nickel permease
MSTQLDRPEAARITMIRQGLSRGEWLQLDGMIAMILALNVIWLVHRHRAGITAPLRRRDQDIGRRHRPDRLHAGMRHAFDADHIAAIDNSNLHHYTGLIGHQRFRVVPLHHRDHQHHHLVGIEKVFRDMRRGVYDEETLEEQLANRGLMNRILRPIMKSITKPGQMYPVGVLFGLGFDTATEVALLVLAAAGAASALPWYAIPQPAGAVRRRHVPVRNHRFGDRRP